jgi:hypothetical protein
LDYLEILPRHFTGFSNYEKRFITAYYRKVLPCNWKAAQEAFLESFHINEVHPQTSTYTTDVGTQYDVFPGCANTSRFVEAFAVPSPAVGERAQQDIVNDMFRVFYGATATAPILPPGVNARTYLAERTRRLMSEANAVDYSACSDVELIDPIQYFLFPNMVIFRGVGFPMVYRFRPNGDDPDSCLFDMIWLRDVPEGQPRPKPAEVMEVGDRRYSEIEGLSPALGMVFHQDTEILALHSLSRYQESRIRHMHHTLDSYLETKTSRE